jgi:hypothetical protein
MEIAYTLHSRLKMNKTKWQSRRWLVCVWAIAMVTAIITAELIRPSGADWIGTVLALMLSIIGGYIASNTITKQKVVQNDSQGV